MQTASTASASQTWPLLRGWTSAAGWMAIAGWNVSGFIDAQFHHERVRNTQFGILTLLCKAAFSHVSVSMCGEQVCIISWLVVLIFGGLLTGWVYLGFLQEEALHFFEHMPLNKRGSIDLQNDGVSPSFSREFGALPNFSQEVQHFLSGSSCESSQNMPARSPDFGPVVYCVWYGWEKLSTSWKFELGMHWLVIFWMRQTASRTISGKCNKQRALFTIERQGAFGWGWNFRKPALSKGHCQLKPTLWI